MPNVYGARDDAFSTLSAPYVSGSGTISFANGSAFGSPSPTSKIPVTIYTGADDPTTWHLYTVLEISGITGNVGTVAGPSPGYTDASAPSGAKARNLILAKYITDLNAAVNGVIPSQSSAAGKFLSTDGTSLEWESVSAGIGIGIGNAVASSTPGSVLFVDSSGNLGQDATKLSWDDTTHTLTGTGTINFPNGGSIGSVTSSQVNSTLFCDYGNAKGYLDTSASGVDFNLVNRVAGNAPLVITLAPGQTADAFRIQQPSGYVLMTLDSLGELNLNQTAVVGNLRLTSIGQIFDFAEPLRLYSNYGVVSDAPVSIGTINALASNAVPLTIQAAPSQTADLQQWQNSTTAVLTSLRADGSLKPAHIADSAAVNDSLYYSTTLSKLCYKDSSGVANALY